MIPHQFHWVWLGQNPLPDKDKKWMRTWRKKHPVWRCTVWAEHPENFDVSEAVLQDFEVRPLPALLNHRVYEGIEEWVTGGAAIAARSDIVRYEIIARYGGVYLDTDVECFHNIEALLDNVRVFVADGEGNLPCNYLLGAVANHPALWRSVRELEAHLCAGYHNGNVVWATGPRYLNPLLWSSPDLVIYPHMLFNPLNADVEPALVARWPPCSYGNHHFDGKWHDGAKNSEVPNDFETSFEGDISSQTRGTLSVPEELPQHRRNLNVRIPNPIPRQFHWVWLGPNPLPERDQQWMRSWQKKHPRWRCTVWAEHPENIEIEDFEVKPLPVLINQKFYNGIEQWVTGRAATASRSDIVRYEIVLQGGIYLDTDVECFGNIEHLLQGVSLFVADEWGPCYGNYMFGASPNHPAIYTVVRELGPHLSDLKTAVNAVQATGPTYLNAQLRKYPDLVIYPHMLFNPLCAFDSPDKVTQWPTVSLANHHFDGKWYDRIKNDPPQEFLRKKDG